MNFTQKVIQFKTKDELILPGILFEPEAKTFSGKNVRPRKVALFLHGNGSSDIFYKQDLHDPIAEELAKAGIAYFPFNNRGAHYVKSFKKMVGGKKVRQNFGQTFEMIRDCEKDIDAAVAHLQKLGFKEFYVLGLSTGANKICVYNYYKPKNIFSKFILLGPGDDTGIYYEMLGKKKFFETLALCQKKIKAASMNSGQVGKGSELVSRELIPFTFISYASLFDTINPDGDYNTFPYIETFRNISLVKKKKAWRELKSIQKPTLVLIGGEDEYCYGDVPKVLAILKEEAPSGIRFECKLLPNADHGFWPKQKQLAKMISKFLIE